jgi:hypothetical protein
MIKVHYKGKLRTLRKKYDVKKESCIPCVFFREDGECDRGVLSIGEQNLTEGCPFDPTFSWVEDNTISMLKDLLI